MKLNQWMLFASGVISTLLISTAEQAPLIAQPDLAFHREQTVPVAQLAQLPQLNPTEQLPQLAQSTMVMREPMMTMPISEGNVSVQLENMTGEAMTYQALGDTEPRTLEADGNITLENLRVPATVTFSYEDMPRDRATGSGLTKADVRSDIENGMLHLVIQPTTDLDTEVSNLTIESGGDIFVF